MDNHLDINSGISIIVPTYKEAENLPKLIERISLLKAQLDPLELIIIDDDSNDGSEKYLQELEQKDKWVRLIVRKNERGLSSAVIDGFKLAKYPILICMDADLSHPPELIPQMAAAILHPNVDFVIGSRFTQGGTIYNRWSFLRWLNAFGAKALAKPFTRAKDPNSGFFCMKQSKFAQADTLNPIGYKIGLELIVKCHCKNIIEIPIHFDKRYKGYSKLTSKEIINYLIHIKRLMTYSIKKKFKL